MKKYLIIALAALTAASCIKGEPFLVRDFVSGYIVDGTLNTDSGLKYHIEKTQVNVEAKAEDRVFVLCDVMQQTGSSETEYDVKLLDYVIPLNKTPLTWSAVTDWDAVGSDPVALDKTMSWFSGGFLNSRLVFYYKEGTKTEHVMNLVYDDVNSTSDSLFFQLRHNAKGETWGADGCTIYNCAPGAGYATFPIDALVPAGKEEVGVKVSWTWYKFEGTEDTTTQTCSITGTYHKR